MSVSMIDGHIDPDTNRMTDKESYPPLQYVDEDYNPIEITSKPTDKEIIKALEYCDNITPCPEDCPLKHLNACGSLKCFRVLKKSLLDLINRQQAENSNLTSDLTSLQNDLTSAKAEIKRLTTLAKLGNMRADDYRAMRDKCKTARAEAIKAFAERLKPKLSYYDEVYVDTLVKEMTEADDESQNT